MRELITQTYYIALPSLLACIAYLLRQGNKKKDANGRGTMLLLRVQLIEYHEKWTRRGHVTKHGLENFMEMYKAYHDLGGNGMVTHLLEEVEELPIKD